MSTRREEDAAGAGGGGTRREDGAAGGGVGGGGGWVSTVLVPVLVGRFRVVEELPRGGEAAVLLVEDRDGSRFVVKQYDQRVTVDVDAFNELAVADEAHVVDVIDWGVDQGRRWEVLEWCEAGTLAGMLASRQSTSDVSTSWDPADVVGEIAEALGYVHGLGLVHRDVKPGNVFVRGTDPLDLVLGDFGLVRDLDEGLSDALCKWCGPT